MLCGCQTIADYNYHFREGQHLHQKQLAKIQVGQTEQQVLSVLGAPLYRNTFDRTRWYYVQHSHAYNKRHSEKVIIEFNTRGRVSQITKS